MFLTSSSANGWHAGSVVTRPWPVWLAHLKIETSDTAWRNTSNHSAQRTPLRPEIGHWNLQLTPRLGCSCIGRSPSLTGWVVGGKKEKKKKEKKDGSETRRGPIHPVSVGFPSPTRELAGTQPAISTAERLSRGDCE